MAIQWITAEDLEDPDNPDAPYAAEYASYILYKLSGEKFAGYRYATEWYGIRRGDYGEGDVCESAMGLISDGRNFVKSSNIRVKTIRLRGKPSHKITSIEEDNTGRLLDPSEYALANNAYVVKRNGFWDLTKNGYFITYTFGLNPPEAGKRAAVSLANEIIKMYDDPDSCTLPQRVTSVSRQGVSYTVLDPQEFITEGRTGLYEVDLFLKAANPAGSLKRPRIFVPGSPRGERYT